MRRAGRARGDDRRLVKAEGEVGRPDVRRQAEEVPDRSPGDLADEVVEGAVDRALRTAVPADCFAHRVAGGAEALGRRVGLTEDLEEERIHGRHGLRGVAVVAVRIALPKAHEAGEAIVLELHHDGRDEAPSAVLRARDPERLAEAQAKRLMADPEGHPALRASFSRTQGRPSTAAWMAAHSPSAPKRTGSATGSPVSAAISPMMRRASASSG